MTPRQFWSVLAKRQGRFTRKGDSLRETGTGYCPICAVAEQEGIYPLSNPSAPEIGLRLGLPWSFICKVIAAADCILSNPTARKLNEVTKCSS